MLVKAADFAFHTGLWYYGTVCNGLQAYSPAPRTPLQLWDEVYTLGAIKVRSVSSVLRDGSFVDQASAKITYNDGT